MNWRLIGVRNGLGEFFGELGQKSVATHHRQLTVQEPVAVVPERTLLSVGDIGASGNCVLPISQAGHIVKRAEGGSDAAGNFQMHYLNCRRNH